MERVAELPAFPADASLQGLPNELQTMIFGNLDKIDAVCLGLSNVRTYEVYKAIHGKKMPLNTRRSGPNIPNMERVWEVVGKNTCPHCGNYRCQLYEHVKSWMPETLEYCQFSQKFGSRAKEGAKETCYRGKPSKPNREPPTFALFQISPWHAMLTRFQVAADILSELPPSTKMTRWLTG
jgi:hypothetical protein